MVYLYFVHIIREIRSYRTLPIQLFDPNFHIDRRYYMWKLYIFGTICKIMVTLGHCGHAWVITSSCRILVQYTNISAADLMGCMACVHNVLVVCIGVAWGMQGKYCSFILLFFFFVSLFIKKILPINCVFNLCELLLAIPVKYQFEIWYIYIYIYSCIMSNPCTMYLVVIC